MGMRLGSFLGHELAVLCTFSMGKINNYQGWGRISRPRVIVGLLADDQVRIGNGKLTKWELTK